MLFKSTNSGDETFIIKLIEDVSKFLNLTELIDLKEPKLFLLCSPNDVGEPIDFHEWLNTKTRSPKYKPLSKTPSFLFNPTQIKKLIKLTYYTGEIISYYGARSGIPDPDFLSNNLKPKSGRFKIVENPRALLPSGNNPNSNKPMMEETTL
jgi:hypothetical protein